MVPLLGVFVRNALRAALLATTSGMSMMPAPVAAQSAHVARTFDIPAQPLALALQRFMQQSGVQLSYPAELADARTSSSISGNLSPAEALSRLLGGTGLTYRFVSPTAVTLEPAPIAPADTVQLGPVRVEAQGSTPNGGAFLTSRSTDPGVTEGKRSFVTTVTTIAKQPQSLREIPQSVSVVTREQIDNQRMDTLGDALRYTPGITVAHNVAFMPTFFSRGFPLTTVQVDGVPFEYANNQSYGVVDLALYDRVEVLRGPASLFNGAGQPSGTINLVKKRPRNEFGVQAELSAGSFDFYRGVLDFTGPLSGTDKIRVRFVGVYQDNGYFFRLAHNRNLLVYGTVEADLTPTTLLSAGISYQNTDQNNMGAGLPTYTDGTLIDIPRSTFIGAIWDSRDANTASPFISFEQQLGGDWTAKLSAQYIRQRTDWLRAGPSKGVDRATGLVSGFTANFNHYGEDQYGLDATSSGSFDLFGRTHKLLAGLNWRQEIYQYDRSQAVAIPGSFPVADALITSPPPPLPWRSWAHTDSRQYGGYLSTSLSIAEPLTVILGGRLSWYRATTQERFPAPQARKHYGIDHKFTPFAGVVLDLARDISAYGSYTDVFQPQGLSTFEGDLLKPVSGKQYEIGLKGGFLDNRLNASLAGFLIRQTNISQADAAHPGYYFGFGGEVESKGIEFQLSGEPLPGWNLSGGYTYNETRITKDVKNQGQPYSTITPRHSLRIWSSYAFRSGTLNGLTIGGGVTASSKFSSNGIVQTGYAKIDALLGYELTPNLALQVNVNNVFDRKYYQNVSAIPYNNQYGDPRNVMATLRTRF